MSKLLEYFDGDTLAADVWSNKYAITSPTGEKEEQTPDDMHRRMARAFAKADSMYEDNRASVKGLSDYGRNRLWLNEDLIYEMFKDFKYIVPQGSIMSQLGNPYSVGSLSNCFSGDVLVLTRQGWKPIRTLEGRSVEIMTKGGKWVFAPFKNYGRQNTMRVTLTNGLRKKVLYATQDHRWAIFKKSKKDSISEVKTTLKLNTGDILYSTYGKGRSKLTLSPMGISHGICYGDGHTVKGANNANNITLCADSRSLGKYFAGCFVSSDESLCEGGSDFYGSLPNYYRELPSINENKSYLYGWLSGYFAADGHIDKRGAAMICSKSEEDILFVMDVCGVLGIGCTNVTSQTVTSNLTNEEHTMYKCFIRKNHLKEDFFLLDKHRSNFNKSKKEPNRWKVDKVEHTDIYQDVYCAEVPETESFVIEGNILSMNCFVLGQPEDSYGGICQKDEEMVQLMKRRGGVGIDLSSLRPNDTTVKNAARTSTGAASFMHRYSNSTREVAQSGRRGALMLSMDIRHPDVMEFIVAKQDLTKVTGANVSVMLRDDFMTAVKQDRDYVLRFPCENDFDLDAGDSMLKNHPYNTLITEKNSKGDVGYFKKIRARDYWKAIVECAWKSAEPGIMFIDRHWAYSPDGVYPRYKGVTTNPCSEIFMQMYDACRLIAKNMYSFVINPFSSDAYIDYELLYVMSYEQQWLGDLLVDLEIMHIDRIINKIASDPEPDDVKRTELELWVKVRAEAKAGRRTGSGPTGYGDMLAALGLKYDSDEALVTLDKVAKTVFQGEWDASIDLAILRGPFEGWDSKLEFRIDKETSTLYGNNDFYKMMTEEFPDIVQRMMKYGRRNVSLSTAAPTGSTSLLSQVSSGIEPVWSVFHIRRKKINPNEKGVRVDFVDQNGDSWQEYPVLHPKFKDWVFMQYQHRYLQGYTGDTPLIESLTKEEVQEWYERSPWYGSTANDISWPQRVEVQGVLQRYITHSISSTVNIPNSATVGDVAEIYEAAWSAGVKGITVYRDGCRTGVLVSDEPQDTSTKLSDNDAPRRPNSLPCKVMRFQNNYEKWVAFIGLFDDRPYEIFTGALDSFPVPNKVDEGRIVKGTHPKLGKTYDFHYSVDGQEFIIKGLSQAFNKEYWNYAKLISSMLRHGMPVFYVAQTVENMSFNQDHINVWKYGVVRALKKFIADGTIIKAKCLSCDGENVIFEEGCSKCLDCGSSKCG